MSDEFASVMLHLCNFVEAEVTPDGDSGRSVSAPENWPGVLSLDDKVVFIHQITGVQLVQTTSMWHLFNVTVTVRLYYAPAGQRLDITAQYDLYHFASELMTAVTRKSRLPVSGTTMPYLHKAATITGATFPVVLPYPVDDPGGVSYDGALFTLNLPIRIAC